MNEPIKHHYIPQFILRNFCFDDKGHTYYYNKNTNEMSVQNTRNLFMSRNLYRDEINTPEHPAKLERDFGAFENEIAKIIKGKFLNGERVTLNSEEDAKLKVFFALMGFRADSVRQKFESGLKQSSQKIYAQYQHNRDFVDFWKQNLGYIVNCRSIQEIIEHPEIDEPIKIFFLRDIFGVAGMYFAVAETYDNEEFVIGDTYPVEVTGELPNGLPIRLYSIFPISSNRIILMVDNGAISAPNDVLSFRQSVLTEPKMNVDGTYTIRVKKMHNEEIKRINSMLIKEAQSGFVCKNRQFIYT